MERTHEEATEALYAGRESRHFEAASVGAGSDLTVMRQTGTAAHRLLEPVRDRDERIQRGIVAFNALQASLGELDWRCGLAAKQLRGLLQRQGD